MIPYTKSHTIKKRKCGHCRFTAVTNAAGLVAHSMEKHGMASPPRQESAVKISKAFSPLNIMGLLAKFLFGEKDRSLKK